MTFPTSSLDIIPISCCQTMSRLRRLFRCSCIFPSHDRSYYRLHPSGSLISFSFEVPTSHHLTRNDVEYRLARSEVDISERLDGRVRDKVRCWSISISEVLYHLYHTHPAQVTLSVITSSTQDRMIPQVSRGVSKGVYMYERCIRIGRGRLMACREGQDKRGGLT